MSATNQRLTRVIKSALEHPEEGDLRGTVLDSRGGVIEFPLKLINWRGREHLKVIPGTLFDPVDLVDKLPDEEFEDFVSDHVVIRKLASYHKYGTVYLSRIQTAANRLIEAIDNYNMGNHPDPSQARRFLQGAFSYFEDCIVEALSGKNGLISSQVVGLRLRYSMMTPFAGTHLVGHDEVLMPRRLAKQIKAWDGDIIMAHREPLLHGPGIMFLKARIVPTHVSDSVRLPWAVFKGMNADCDGDLAFLCNISKHLATRKLEEREQALAEIKRIQQKDSKVHEYDASLCLLSREIKPDISSDSSFITDINTRLDDMEGLSFGCEDIFTDKPEDGFLGTLQRNLDLDPDRVLKYANGMTREEYAEDIFDTARALCYTKRGLGKVGAAGNYCMLLGCVNRLAMPGAVLIKEGLSQTVLDAKHGEDLDHIQDALDILMKAGKYEEASITKRVNALVQIGFPRLEMELLMDAIGDTSLVNKVFRDFPTAMLTSSNKNSLSLLRRFIDGEPERGGPASIAGSWFDSSVLPAIDRVREEELAEDEEHPQDDREDSGPYLSTSGDVGTNEVYGPPAELAGGKADQVRGEGEVDTTVDQKAHS